MDIDRYLPRLKAALTPARLRHSLGVMQVMGELAPVYGLDREQAMTSGLLHDAAKDFSPEQQEAGHRACGYQIKYPVERDYNLYLHGPVCAYVVETEHGVTDRLILNAIKTHTAVDGEDFDHPLSWCLRFSDLLEPNRDWRNVPWLAKGLPRLRDAAFGGRLDEAALLQYGWVNEWFTAFGFPVHPNFALIAARQMQRLKIDAGFLNEG